MTSKKSKDISRRKFINLGVQGYTGLQIAQGLPPALLAATGCSTTNSVSTVHGVCYHDCPDSCSWEVTLENGTIKHFGADKENPFTAGKLCHKMETFPQDITFNPDRVLTPLKRSGKKGEGKFEEISWEQALEEVADRLQAMVAEYGGESVLPFGYMGTQGILQKSAMSNRFFTKLGASQLAKTICGAAAITGNMVANGQSTGILPEDVVHSRYIVLWGTNTKHSNVHLWPYVLKARQDGAKIVVIDPFKSATAIEADWHIQPLPGTDVALALGMMHVLMAEDLCDQNYIDQYTIGFEDLQKHVQQYDPATVAEICDLEETEIVKLAQEYANAQPSLIRTLIGMEHNINGGDANRAVSMLPALTGAWRHRGGGLLHFTYELAGEALNWERIDMYRDLSKKETRTINMVQLGKALNKGVTDPPIHSLFVYNANPIVTIPNQNLIREGLEREDLFTVVLEHFITDTALYADYIFPATTQLEHWDVADSWGQIYINLNQPAIKPLGQSKPNTEFFRLLAKKMGFQDDCFNETDEEIARSLFQKDHPYMEGVTFDYLMQHGWARLKVPEPWLPHQEGNFGTDSGKCEFYSSSLQENGKSPLPEYKRPAISVEHQEQFPLWMLTVKSTKGFHNSSHANVKHLIDAEGNQTLRMSVQDAQSRGIAEGDPIKAYNQNGEVLLTARIDHRVRPGVVCMPHGFWPSLVKGGATSNALTSHQLTDLGGGAALQDCRVEVERTKI